MLNGNHGDVASSPGAAENAPRVTQLVRVMATALLVAAPASLAAQGAGPMATGQWPTFWWLVPLVFLLVMAVMCFGMLRHGGMRMPWNRGGRFGSGEPAGADNTPLRILDTRFAKGEIDRQEYEEKKALLAGSSSGAA